MSKLNINLAEVDEEMDVDEELVDEKSQTEETEETGDNAGNSSQKNGEKSSKKDKINPQVFFDALPETTRKDKTLKEVLELVGDEYAPVIPDAVTDFYLAKNGLSCPDVRLKRLLALATQKFVSDIATNAYEYSRIRSTSALYNSSNSQARARALVAGQSATSSGGPKHERIVLTTEDLSSALSEYGLNAKRPDFYR